MSLPDEAQDQTPLVQLCLSLIDKWPTPLALFDESLRLQLASQRLTDQLGIEVSDSTDLTPETLLGDEATAFRALFDRVLLTGQSVRDVEMLLPRPDGGAAVAFASISPVEADGMRGVVFELTAIEQPPVQTEAQWQSEVRDRALLLATAQMLWRGSPEGEVREDSPTWRAFTGQTMDEFRGTGWLQAVHPDDRAQTQQTWADSVPARTAFSMEYRLRAATGEYHLVLARVAPVFVDQRISEWSVCNIDLTGITAPGSPEADVAARLELLGGQQAALRELAAHLSEAMSRQEVVDLALSRAPDLLAAHGALIVLTTHDRGLRVAGQRTMPRDSGARWRLVPDDVDFPAARAIRGNTRVREDREDGFSLCLDSVPLRVDDDVVGAVTFAWEDTEFQHPEFVADVAEVIAQALGRAQDFEREQSISVNLQRGMLPSTLPRVDGAEIGALYLPGSEEADVGGDWFESILLDDGRLLLAVGDVMGKGLPAATTMSEFRHALKALSVVTSSPAEILGHLARYHATRSGDKDQLITLILALVDLSAGDLSVASAGHIPAYLVHHRPTAPEILDEAKGLPLGLGETWTEHRRTLADGDSIVLVSDGLVEDRTRNMVEGLAVLEQALGSIDSVSAAQVCDQVVEKVVGQRTRADDVTVLCLRVDAEIDAAGLQLPAVPASVPRAREYVQRELERLGVRREEVQETVRLLTSELVTNAVRHSSEDITVCVDRVDRLVRVTVVDSDPMIRLEPRPVEVEAEHGRGLQLVEALATQWGVSAMPQGKQVWFELTFTR